MKSNQSTESFCLSILTIYANDWSTFWYVYWCHVCFFFCEIPKYVQAKNGLARLDWHYMEVGSQAYWAGWRLWMQAGSVPSNQKFSCKWTFFMDVLSNGLSFYQGNPLHIISSLFRHFCLFQNAILHKMLKLGFWNFKLFFLKCSFHRLQHFFSLVLVISLSWYLYLTHSHEFSTFI